MASNLIAIASNLERKRIQKEPKRNLLRSLCCEADLVQRFKPGSGLLTEPQFLSRAETSTERIDFFESFKPHTLDGEFFARIGKAQTTEESNPRTQQEGQSIDRNAELREKNK